MTWTLQKPKKHSAFSAPSGSDGEKESSEPSRAITNSVQSNETPSSQSSLNLMIGLFLLNPHGQSPNDFYRPFTQKDIDEYIERIHSYSELTDEINRIQTCMIEAEKCFGDGLLSREEHVASVSKLTLLFKALLYCKERGTFTSHLVV